MTSSSMFITNNKQTISSFFFFLSFFHSTLFNVSFYKIKEACPFGRVMYEKLVCSATYRMPISMYEEIEVLTKGENKKFKSMPEASRHLIQMGLRFLKLKEIMADPARKEEFLKKANLALNEKTLDEAVDAMTPEELDALVIKLESLKDSKIKQMILQS